MIGKSFRPKENLKGYLPVPATFNNIRNIPSRNFGIYLTFILFFLLWLSPINLSSFSSKSNLDKYPPPHPFTSPNVITTSSVYIFPQIEHLDLLRELGRSKLVKESRVRNAEHPEIDVSLIQSLNAFDDPDPLVQLNKEKEENTALALSNAKNMFKNGDKIVYKPKSMKNYPEVVIVSAIDFEKYSLDALKTIVQNRVDYAHQHNYGVYVRWYQEFLPWMESFANFDNAEKRKWIRAFCLRSAMYAFPNTKWFWYLDEDGLIMNLNINLNDYILNELALGPIMLREQAINPQNGIIRTYKTTKPSHIRLIVTQSETKIETDSFILKNDDVGKSMLEFWTTNLFFQYPNFPFGPDSALTHILQWHPFCLSRAAIIPARTMASRHTNEEIKEDDHLHYVKGDFTVSWSDCKDDECERTLKVYKEILGM